MKCPIYLLIGLLLNYNSMDSYVPCSITGPAAQFCNLKINNQLCVSGLAQFGSVSINGNPLCINTPCDCSGTQFALISGRITASGPTGQTGPGWSATLQSPTAALLTFISPFDVSTAPVVVSAESSTIGGIANITGRVGNAAYLGWTPTTNFVDFELAGCVQATPAQTPIRHVVVVMLENQSFDNIFGTYPIAQNNPGENPFTAKPGTPKPDNLLSIDPLTGGTYLTTNRNVGQNGTGRVNPIRLSPEQQLLNMEAVDYTRLQQSVDNGLMDHYILDQITPAPIISVTTDAPFDATYGNGANIIMSYFDGNTYTGFWNYAQNYSMSDRAFTTGYGESVIGAINWASGDTAGIVPQYPGLIIDTNLLNAIFEILDEPLVLYPPNSTVTWAEVLSAIDNVVLYDWILPNNDISILFMIAVYYVYIPESLRAIITFPNTSGPVQFFQQFVANSFVSTNKNIGDLLNQKALSWGGFAGGFLVTPPFDPNQEAIPAFDFFYEISGDDVTIPLELEAIIPNFNSLYASFHYPLNPIPQQGSGGQTIAEIIGPQEDFEPVYQPFNYYESTNNQHLNPPISVGNVGHTDAANHQYDLSMFYQTLASGNLPAVSYIRLADYQNSHNTVSDAYDCQYGMINLINTIMDSPFWEDTAIFFIFDESNGNYDHVAPPLVKSSCDEPYDPAGGIACNGVTQGVPVATLRAGYAPRTPFLLISSWAKQNYISHTTIDQTSILNFIENNWQLGQIGNGSYDAIANSLNDLFDFDPSHIRAPRVYLDPTTGNVTSIVP